VLLLDAINERLAGESHVPVLLAWLDALHGAFAMHGTMHCRQLQYALHGPRAVVALQLECLVEHPPMIAVEGSSAGLQQLRAYGWSTALLMVPLPEALLDSIASSCPGEMRVASRLLAY
jgi:hypothetical protein